MNDPELYELCMAVRRATEWKDTEQTIAQDPGNPPYRRIVNTEEFLKSDGLNYAFDAPLYTSDYLLDKLKSGAGVIKDSQGYTARRPHSLGSPENKDPLNGRIGWQSDTAVKALLTMIIELDKVGMLDA